MEPVTVEAFVFNLREPRPNTLPGIALVVPGARYCSRYFMGAERMDRRFATPGDWLAVERECSKLPPEPFARDTAIARLLLGTETTGLIVTFLRREAVQIAAPSEAVAALRRAVAWGGGAPLEAC
jgi:hypothetical protein